MEQWKNKSGVALNKKINQKKYFLFQTLTLRSSEKVFNKIKTEAKGKRNGASFLNIKIDFEC